MTESANTNICTPEEQASRDFSIRECKREMKKNFLQIAFLVYETCRTKGWRYAYSSVEEWAHQEHGFSRRTLFNLRKVGEQYNVLLALDSSVLSDFDALDPSKLVFLSNRIKQAKTIEQAKEMIADAKTLSYRDLEKKYKKNPDHIDFVITAEIESITRQGKRIVLKNVNFNYEVTPTTLFLSCKNKKFKISFMEI